MRPQLMKAKVEVTVYYLSDPDESGPDAAFRAASAELRRPRPAASLDAASVLPGDEIDRSWRDRDPYLGGVHGLGEMSVEEAMELYARPIVFSDD